MRKILSLSSIILGLALAPVAARASDTLTLLFSDLEPYVVSTSNGVEGFLAHHLNQVGDEAGITINWQYIPWEQQIPLLKRKPPNVCGVGLFDIPERRSFLRFSVPIGKDYGIAVAVRKDDGRMVHDSLQDMLEDGDLTGMLQKNTSYGPIVDKILEGHELIVSPDPTLRAMRDIVEGKADYLLATAPTFERLVPKYGFENSLKIRSDLSDMQDHVLFFLGCTHTTPTSLTDRMDQILLQKGPVCPDGPCQQD
ncbi:MAG: transporter substrate-binding domain-containing protein [Alphaproteobacteria bacterium]|nr:transporter substrate-binding domain-containing protein [Alphaproteobacteria bacterium]